MQTGADRQVDDSDARPGTGAPPWAGRIAAWWRGLRSKEARRAGKALAFQTANQPRQMILAQGHRAGDKVRKMCERVRRSLVS